MDIKTFVNVISKLPPEIAVLAKGPTGIGKSDIVHQIANRLDMPVIDRRLSQMTEGDIIGLPELIDGTTRFAPVNWFVEACKNPRVLFFDELNRATIEVQQCAFQIVLDRELNGHKLHPETRVYAAVNEGSDYQVTEMDPALLRRFYAVELEPTTQDWLEWAETKGNISSLMTSFIRKYPAHLRHIGEMNPGTVYPNPASWSRLDRTIKYAGIDLDSEEGNSDSIIYSFSLGFIGATTATAFYDYVKNYKQKFGPKDVVYDYSKNKSKLDKLSNDKKNDLLQQIVHFVDGNKKITVANVENVVSFTEKCSDEMAVSFYNSILELDTSGSNTTNIDIIKKFSKYYSGKVVSLYNKALGVR